TQAAARRKRYRPIHWFNPRTGLRHGMPGEMLPGTGCAHMPEQTGDKAIVHIVDDDYSLRRAVDSLCRSIGLQSRTYGSAQEFLDGKREDIAGCLVLASSRVICAPACFTSCRVACPVSITNPGARSSSDCHSPKYFRAIWIPSSYIFWKFSRY